MKKGDNLVPIGKPGQKLLLPSFLLERLPTSCSKAGKTPFACGPVTRISTRLQDATHGLATALPGEKGRPGRAGGHSHGQALWPCPRSNWWHAGRATGALKRRPPASSSPWRFTAEEPCRGPHRIAAQGVCNSRQCRAAVATFLRRSLPARLLHQCASPAWRHFKKQ